MSEKENEQKKVNVHMPETDHKAMRLLFVMLVAFSCLLIAFFVMDQGREAVKQKFEALRDGVVATMPLQYYLSQYHTEHQAWPQEGLALQEVEVELPESVNALTVAADGTVILTYTQAVQEGAEIHLKPRVEADGKVRWLCLGKNMPEDILPQECRLITP